jgi:hypothetical protein
MTSEYRNIERCPWRDTADGNQRACCNLLQEITGVENRSLCLVDEDVCRSCCQSFPPSSKHLNPVVASQLYRLTSEIVNRSGVSGCELRRAAQLNDFASRDIPFDTDQLNGPPSKGQTALLPQKPMKQSRWRHLIRRWAVGVTTTARDVETLPLCLQSIMTAGWTEPRVFVDGEMDMPSGFARLPTTLRLPRMGAWPSYYLALAELVMRSPDADADLLVQDDAVCVPYPGLREYLESVLWPRRKYGIASLYCSRAYTQASRGWYLFSGSWRWGALAFVFSRPAAQRFLGDSYTVLHRWAKSTGGKAAIDITIGDWAKRCRVPVYFPTPSLVQHIGEVSSIWKTGRAFGDRRASWFAAAQADLP